MPPRPVITREAVLDCAFELVRKEGIDALSARAIAQALGCSTQPVYSACGSMTEVRAEIEKRALRAFTQHFAPSTGPEPPLLQLGLATLRLAKSEPKLFALASAWMRRRLARPPHKVIEAMKLDPELSPLSERQLVRLHAALWIFSQGLASLSDDEDTTEAEAMLRHAGRALIEHELSLSRAGSQQD